MQRECFLVIPDSLIGSPAGQEQFRLEREELGALAPRSLDCIQSLFCLRRILKLQSETAELELGAVVGAAAP
jgi:hypothetical protein